MIVRVKGFKDLSYVGIAFCILVACFNHKQMRILVDFREMEHRRS